MARPTKKSLLYFNVDTDIFDDEKLVDISMTYGPLGEAVFWRLMCWVYSSENGYYYEFTNLNSLATKLIKSIGNKWARDKKTVIDIILYLGEIDLFSAELIQRNVITSRGLQRRYLKATERRQSTIGKYSLLEKNELPEGSASAAQTAVNDSQTAVNVTETEVCVSNNATKKKKEKEIKENKNMSLSDPASLLSKSQREELVGLSSVGSVETYEEKIFEWQRRSGKRCRDPFGTIKKWIAQDKAKGSLPGENKGESKSDSSYDVDEYERLAQNYDYNNAPWNKKGGGDE